MKRHGGLFPRIVAAENIELAFAKARKGKTWQDSVKEVERENTQQGNPLK